MFGKKDLNTRQGGARVLLCVVILVCGCAGSAEREPVSPESFFPSAPDLPRIQYLRSLNGSVDFVPKKTNLLRVLAGEAEGAEYVLEKPFSVAAHKDRIYVTDSFGAQGLLAFAMDPRQCYLLGKTRGSGFLRKPIHIFVDTEGNKYVSDLLRREVVVFGPDDTFLRAYGKDQFVPVSSVATDKELFVLDIAKDQDPDDDHLQHRRDQVVVLDLDTGKILYRIGTYGKGRDGFSFATHLALDDHGHIYLADTHNYRVLKMDREGNVLVEFGRHGDRAGDFDKIKGIAVDRQGLIYVVDAAFQNVQVFDNAGTPLFVFGGHRAPRGAMDLPAGIWIDYDNVEFFRDYIDDDFEVEYLVYVTNQLSRKHRVNVYAYGKRRGIEYPNEGLLQLLGRDEEAQWTLPVFPAEATQPRLQGVSRTN